MRPISLAPCLLKVMERMINLRISWWLEHHGKLPKSQFGFRRAKSCIDNLAILTSEIQLAFGENKNLVALFIDIKGAYDNVLAEVLIDRLKRLGFPPTLLNFVYNLVARRQLNISFGDIHETLWSYRGLPQGSVLSPILYSLYMRELEEIMSQDCEIL